MLARTLTKVLSAAAVAGVVLAGATAWAGVLLVAGSPTYDPATSTGLKDGQVLSLPGWGVNNSGTAVGYSGRYVSGASKGYSGVRWDASGTAATELGNLGVNANGAPYANAYAVNDAGTAVGYSDKYVNLLYMGQRAVRWDASGTAATELGNLGASTSGSTQAYAYAINNAGTAVGYANAYSLGYNMGQRAVRWAASGTSATALGNLGTDSSGVTYARAYAVNDAGTAVGYAYKYAGSSNVGQRAVRWDASGTAATELGNLGVSTSGYTQVYAYAVNNAGTAVGYAEKYASGNDVGQRAVRWDASGTTATELGNLGTDSSGVTVAQAYAVNDAGTAVGYSRKYAGSSSKGNRAVRWDASGTATELGNLGTDSGGYTNAYAYAVNKARAAVGYADKYAGGAYLGSRAVIWLPDATAIDLNDLGVSPVPAGGTWTLTTAKAISADGWVAGGGAFDPDGPGPLASYSRLWVAQVGIGGTWTNAAGGTWGRGPNWSTGTPAMQVGDATFGVNASYSVALDRNEQTQTIAVNAGVVTIDFAGHTLSSERGLSIAQGATLQGAGTIASDITSAGTIDPGNSPGTLAVTGSLTNTGTLDFEIADASLYDKIDLTGAFVAGGTIKLKLLGGYKPASGTVLDLMDFGSFSDQGYTLDVSEAALPTGLKWDTSRFATTGSLGVVAVPEPATWALLASGGLAVLLWGLRRRAGIN